MPPLWTELTDSLSYRKHVAQWNSTSGTCSDKNHVHLTFEDIVGLDSVALRLEGFLAGFFEQKDVTTEIHTVGSCSSVPIE